MTPSEIEPATFRFVAQRLNRCVTAVSHTVCTTYKQKFVLPFTFYGLIYNMALNKKHKFIVQHNFIT